MGEPRITLTLGIILIFPTDYATEVIPHRRRKYIEIRIYRGASKRGIRSFISKILRRNVRTIRLNGFEKLIYGTHKARRTRIGLYKMALRRGKTLTELRISGLFLILSRLGLEEALSLIRFLLSVRKRGAFRSFLKRLLTLLVARYYIENVPFESSPNKSIRNKCDG